MTHLRLPHPGHRSASARPPSAREGPDERSTTLDHRSPPRWSRPARRRVYPARSAARARRSHRWRHRGTAAPLFDRPRARWSLAGRVQDPPRLPLSTMRRGVQRLHLSAHPRRAVGRQGRPRKCRRPPVRVHHPHRTLLRPGAPIPGEGRSALAVPSPPTCPDLPPWPTHVLR
jgi:hypothetical protein